MVKVIKVQAPTGGGPVATGRDFNPGPGYASPGGTGPAGGVRTPGRGNY
jgi:hypothetical protein